MSLFPKLGPQYLDEPYREILSRMESTYAEAITINQAFWVEADTDLRFYSNDQSLCNDMYGNLPVTRRQQFSFNRIRSIVEVTSGYQSRNRKSTIVVPIENGDAATADQFTKILMHINQQEGVLDTITESFRGALITGMNFLQMWIDYRNDPVSGEIKVDNCSYNTFLVDPYFRKADLSDCNFMWKRSFLTKREIISLLPDKYEEILGLSGIDSPGRDAKFQFIPESYNYGMKNLLTYDEYYYRDYRKQKLLVDTQNGETIEWKSPDDDKLKSFLSQNPTIELLESEVPTVRLAIVVQGRVMFDGPNPIGIDRYPFIPVLAYYEPAMPYFPHRIQGQVRQLRDAQYLYNRRKNIQLDILESQINSGWKYKEDSLVNPKDVFLSGQGRGLALKQSAQMTDVEQIQCPRVDPSMIQLSEILAKELQQISGVNEELLGSAVDDKAGILSMLRQGAGLTSLQRLFDQLDRSQKLLGSLMIEAIQNNYTPGKVKRILENQDPTPEFYNKNFGKYHASVEEGLNTTTQKQMQFAQLIQLREIGVAIPDDQLLNSSTLQNKKELVESIKKQQEQAQQAQQMQMQAALQEQAARTELAQARAVADQGLGVERLSRVEENRALAEERRAAAIKDQDLALLNLVKALKEIDTLDLNHVEQLLNMSHAIKNQEIDAQEIQEARKEPRINS